MANINNDKNPFGKFNWKDWRHMLPVFLVLAVLIYLGYRYQVDNKVIVGGTVVIGLLSGICLAGRRDWLGAVHRADYRQSA